MHVFLLFSGTNDRAVIALLRAMKALGQPVCIVARSAQDLILRSAYRRQVIAVRPDDQLSGAIISQYVRQAQRLTGASAVTLVPVSEYFNTVLLRDRAVLEAIPGCVVPLAAADLYAKVSNKQSAAAFFAAAGLLVPAEFAVPTPARIPFVAKPRTNVAGAIVRYPVLIRTQAEWAAFSATEHTEHYFYQQYVTGQSFYLLAYMGRDGGVYTSSQHNLLQQPGGKSMLLARTADFQQHAASQRALAALQQAGFFGFAMIEFIVNQHGAFFIELNPRPWGPLNLCLNHSCGIVEAFIGDFSRQDCAAFQQQRLSKRRNAAYLWAGGLMQALRSGKPVQQEPGRTGSALRALRYLPDDVYLKADSWKIFIKELMQ